MYLSNSKFIKSLLSEQVVVQDLEQTLELCNSLYKKFGSKLKLPAFQSLIRAEHESLAQFFEVLIQQHKLNKKDLNEMLYLVAASSESVVKEFDVIGKSSEKIEKRIRQTFPDAEITQTSRDDIALEVHGDGRYYKRSLAKDLDALL